MAVVGDVLPNVVEGLAVLREAWRVGGRPATGQLLEIRRLSTQW